jgi:hypothetical protein
MNFILHPWHLLIYILAGWINRHQQDAIDYLKTENQILREKLGNRRIQGALANLGFRISDTTVANILKAHGIEPAPRRRTTWKSFLKTHWDSIAAADFTTVEVYHRERNHQGLDNRIIDVGDEIGRTNGEIQEQERLGGMLRYYYRKAA